MKNLGKLTSVKWRDSRMYITQCNKDDKFEVSEILSVGYIVKEDSKSITLAGDVIDDGDIRRVIIIPKENII